jgi:hypothetical protein
MTLRPDDDAPDLPALPREKADRVLRRAIELESAMGEVVTGEQLKDIARQVDLDPHYLRMALAEIEAAEPESAPRRTAGTDAGLERPAWAPGAWRDVSRGRTVAALLGGGILGMLAGLGVGATMNEVAGTAAFFAGAAVFVIGMSLVLVTPPARSRAAVPAREAHPPLSPPPPTETRRQ